eukprot:COSAG03_NODE_372_length_8457_cov_11.870424_3_plen_121_part_00
MFAAASGPSTDFNKHKPVEVSVFKRTPHIVAPTHPTRRRVRTHWFASTAQLYAPTSCTYRSQCKSFFHFTCTIIVPSARYQPGIVYQTYIVTLLAHCMPDARPLEALCPLDLGVALRHCY